MDVSGGGVSITESRASQYGGGEWVAFLVLEQGTRDAPPRSGMQCVRGSAVWGGGFLRGLQADATPAATQQVILFTSQCSPGLPASASVYASRLSYSRVLGKS